VLKSAGLNGPPAPGCTRTNPGTQIEEEVLEQYTRLISCPLTWSAELRLLSIKNAAKQRTVIAAPLRLALNS